jgi:C_GCAxxG_C_C family probable redox protein
MKHSEKAVSLYKQSFYCSQAVFAAFADELGIDEKTALRTGSCFGGGMCKGEVCGACTGALMVLGMKYGRDEPDDLEKKTKANDMAIRFLDCFKEKNGSYICNELLGCDISTTEGKTYAREQKLFSELCPELVESAAEILDQMIE